jgi:ribonuclease I
MTENKSLFESVVAWLNAGYPQGVPPKDYFPVLALLKRSLAEEEVVTAAQSVLKNAEGDTVTENEIRTAVHAVNGQEPNPEEIHQVASRLASVGWPLATPAR